MGVAHRAAIAARLLAGGLAPDTAVLAVHWGTRPEQRSIRTRLDQLGATPLEPPVTLVIGAVAGLDLDWYQRRPLFGRQIVVTRAQAQAGTLSARLRELGARPDRGADHSHRAARRWGSGLTASGRPARAGELRLGRVQLGQRRRGPARPAGRRPVVRAGSHRGHRSRHRRQPSKRPA